MWGHDLMCLRHKANKLGAKVKSIERLKKWINSFPKEYLGKDNFFYCFTFEKQMKQTKYFIR